MLYSLWDDPAWSAKEFATLLRLFKRKDHLPPRYLLSGKYEILGQLGSGGNGDVFFAWSRETTSLYALKVIKSSLCYEQSVINRFKKEVETWVTIGEHPNIVKAHFLDVVGDTLHMTMEYIEGGATAGASLIDRIQSVGRDPSSVAACFVHVADGLHHAYQHGVRSHRDIKPGNILIARDGTAKLTDFGLVARFRDLPGVPLLGAIVTPDDDTAPGSLLGTPPYMAPEQFTDVSQCDQRSDIYALGITLYQVVSGGKLPFLPSSPRNASPLDARRFLVELYWMHQNAEPPRLHSPFWPVIEKCLAKQPDCRFANVMEFREAIEAVGRARKFGVPAPATGIDDIWTYRDRGNTLLRLGKYKEAIAAFDMFQAKVPDSSVLFNRAVCLQNRNRLNEALEIYQKFIQGDDHDDYKACINAANCLRRLGRAAEAAGLALRATELQPGDWKCWNTIGNIRHSAGQFADAIEAYQRALAVSPSEPTPHYNLGLARIEHGDAEGAARSLGRFLRLASPHDERRAQAITLLSDIGIVQRPEPT
jgi:serine/threonine protein kinase